jgi:hydroxymethylglutaryl-CoA lyase
MEVGPRDGLQNEKTIVDTASKIGFIEQLVEAGAKRVEITAFVSPKWIPPLADQVEVARGIRRKPDVSYAALVPNMRGYEQALACQVSEVAFVLAASQTHNLKNINAKTEDAFDRYAEVAARAREDQIPFRAYVSCAMGCPYEGDVPVQKVVELAAKFFNLGAYEISIGDTIGVGNPKQTLELVNALQRELPVEKRALHLHDTRGQALANIFAALSLGVSAFDSSVGGLGGCPYAPGASGNVATEDLVYMLHAMGIETGIDLDKLCDVSLKMEKLLKRELPSKILATRRCAPNTPVG